MNGHTLHKLVAGFVRRTWLLTLVATLACAAFAATAVASLVEASYLAPASHGASLPAPAVMDKPVVKVRPDGSGIVVRNMFCSTCTPLPGPGPADSYVPPAILIATSVGAESRATVRATSSDAQGSYGIGDLIPTVGKVDRIGWRSIDVIDSTGRRGKLDLLDTDAGRRGGPGAATPDPAAAPDPFAGRIKKIDDHTFEVDRDLVRDLVSGTVKPNGLRITPVSDNGQLKGLRLFGVKPGTVAGNLGLQNGDTLTSINNNQIKSAQTLLDVYAQMDTLNVVELDGTRAGKPLALTLRLK